MSLHGKVAVSSRSIGATTLTTKGRSQLLCFDKTVGMAWMAQEPVGITGTHVPIAVPLGHFVFIIVQFVAKAISHGVRGERRSSLFEHVHPNRASFAATRQQFEFYGLIWHFCCANLFAILSTPDQGSAIHQQQ